MKYIFWLFLLIPLCSISQEKRTKYFPKTRDAVKPLPDRKNVWVFLLAGQSNMAGRGLVEPQDTLPNKRVLSIDAQGRLIYAKEPIHFLYEPPNNGLDCGLSFGKALVDRLPGNISVLILPTAIGGSSVSQWLGDSLFRNVKLLSNFKEKANLGKKYGIIKGILWLQGEADATPKGRPLYKQRVTQLFKIFRSSAGNPSLPVILAELGPFPYSYEEFMKMNLVLKDYCKEDKNSALISTGDLKHKGDSIHFDSPSQRIIGQRYAEAYLRNFNKK